MNDRIGLESEIIGCSSFRIFRSNTYVRAIERYVRDRRGGRVVYLYKNKCHHLIFHLYTGLLTTLECP